MLHKERQNIRHMNKNILSLLFMLFPVIASAQVTKPGEIFTQVYTVEDKVVFLKEIEPKENDLEKNYFILKEWIKINYAKDPFNSNSNYDNKNHSVMATTRVELLLPPNIAGIQEKITMKYRLDVFFSGNLCVIEISGITFQNKAKENSNTLPKKITAEDMISDIVISIDDSNKETRINTRKSTIYYFNELLATLQNVLN